MTDSGIGLQISGNNESVETSVVTTGVDAVSQQSPQVLTTIAAIDSSTDQNQLNSQSCSSANSGVNVSMSASILTPHHSESQNVLSSGPNISSVVSTSMPSANGSIQGSTQTQTSQSHSQLMVNASQPQMVSTSQSGHLNVTNAIMGQSLAGTPTLPSMTSQANAQTVHITHQSPQHTPILHTSVQPTQHHNHMSVQMSHLPQVQVIQQPIGGTAGTYQFQQVYPQQMLLPSNLTIQNMPFGAPNQGLSLQIPFTTTNAVNSGQMPITSIASKPPIMSKGVAISPLTQGIATSQHHMISSLKPNLGAGNASHILKQVLPAQQYSTNQTVVISQLLPQHNPHSMQQSILPATSNRTILDTNKGKPFGSGSVRSSFGNKMFSHSGTIQPKSPILPASSSMSSISSPLMTNPHFKNTFPGTGNATQLIATQTPGLITNQQQIFGSIQTLPQGLTCFTTAPQSAHLVAQNGSPIFIRTPTQSGEHMYIQTSTPQIQTVTMATPINVHSSGTTMHMNAAQTHSSPLTATSIAASLQQTMSIANAITTTTTTMANNSAQQPTAIAPAPNAPTTTKPRPLRPASSVATQTATSAMAQKQHAESSTSTPTPPKPIAPAKPKPNSQTLPTSTKSVNKEQNTATPLRATSVAAATTQTISHQTLQQTSKTDAANQTTKVSVGTETPKSNNQVSSSRNSISDAKHSSVKTNSSINLKTNSSTNTKSNSSTNTNTTPEMSQPKINSVPEEGKPITKRHVEKKDASTGQDSDSITTFFAQQQHNHQSVQNSVQITSNGVPQQNGQIAVLADLNRQDISKQPPQKAIVKPQILTHVIDGYIIQESPNPFPVNGLNYSSDQKPLNDEKNNSIIPIESMKSSKNKNENSLNTIASSSARNRSSSEQHMCLNCGLKRKNNSKSNKKSKRFCSSSCADKFKNNIDKTSTTNRLSLYNSVTSHLEINELQRGQDFSNESSVNETEKSSHEEKKRLKSMKKSHEISNDFSSTKNGDINVVNSNQRKSTTSADIVVDRITLNNSDSQITRVVDEASSSDSCAGIFIPPGGKNPLKWSVQDVYEFVRNLQGCTEYADEFRSQEIDGQALMLLKEDHLMSAMNMKLGPALKICNKINALREDVQKQT